LTSGAQKRTPKQSKNNNLNCKDRNKIVIEKENAATSAKVSGVNDVLRGVYLFGDYIAALPLFAMHWGAM
jgi:hypothetical protein